MGLSLQKVKLGTKDLRELGKKLRRASTRIAKIEKEITQYATGAKRDSLKADLIRAKNTRASDQRDYDELNEKLRTSWTEGS